MCLFSVFFLLLLLLTGLHRKVNIHLCCHSTCSWSEEDQISRLFVSVSLFFPLSLSLSLCFSIFIDFHILLVCAALSSTDVQRQSRSFRLMIGALIWTLAQGYGEGGVFRELQDPPWLLPAVPWYCKKRINHQKRILIDIMALSTHTWYFEIILSTCDCTCRLAGGRGERRSHSRQSRRWRLSSKSNNTLAELEKGGKKQIKGLNSNNGAKESHFRGQTKKLGYLWISHYNIKLIKAASFLARVGGYVYIYQSC